MLKNYAITWTPQGCIFQQDRTPPHYANPVKAFVSQQFPGKWIRRWGSYRMDSQVTRFEPFRVLSMGVPKGLVVPVEGARCGQNASPKNYSLRVTVTPEMLQNMRQEV
jgi:hypothetical protein